MWVDSVKLYGIALVATALFGCSSGGNVDIGSGQGSSSGSGSATVQFPMAYVKKTLPEEQDDLFELRDSVSDAAAAVWVRERADPTAPEKNITERVTGDDLFDIRDLDVAFDGSKIVFAMRGPLDEDQDEEDPPTWNVWEYTFATDTLRRVVVSDTIAEEGHDVAPHYLPDGRIVFSSSRQKQSKAILLDEGKSQFEAQTESRNEPAFVLHVMNADGTDIHQISFNPDHDLDPAVLLSGKVFWSRWDDAPGTGSRGIHLYQSNPDGTGLELLYGAQSHMTGSSNSRIEFVKSREMSNGEVLSLVRPQSDTDFGGDLYIIDTKTYVENTQAVAASAGMNGPAQRRATGNDVRTVEGISPGGRFISAFPLWDGTNRIVVSWAQCLAVLNGAERPCTNEVVANPAALPAPPAYSIWMYDTNARAFLPLMTPVRGTIITDVVIAQPRTAPAVILDKTPVLDLDPDLVSEGVGILDIRSVYDLDGVDSATGGIRNQGNPTLPSYENRQFRFLRLEKIVSIPDDDVLDFDNTAFGVTNYMREILGYVPIEPDGSVRVKVPANVAFQFSLVDRDGRRVGGRLHRNWLQVRPGEVRSCNGCHTRNAQAPTSHGRTGAFNSAYTGALSSDLAFPGTTAAAFPVVAGETMAQNRARQTCADTSNKCASITPSVNVVYTDVWSDPVGDTPEASFNLSYVSLSPDAPVADTCITRWSATCRIVINYIQSIEPLWTKDRPTGAVDGMGTPITRTCAQAGCHSPTNAANALQIPAGGLDLTDGPSQDVPTQENSYRQLVATHNLCPPGLNDPACFVQVGVDPINGTPILSPATVPGYLAATNARGSRFFTAFAAGGPHATGYLTADELRLLSEWVDIGAQYFNNPFDPAVPLN